MISIDIEVGDTKITIGKYPPYKLLDHHGLDAPAIDVSAQSYGATDGGYIQKRHIPPRPITIVFDIVGDKNDVLRNAITRICTPHKDVTIIVNRFGVVRKISGVLTNGTDITQQNIFDTPKVTLELLCADPYFSSVDNFGRNLAEKKALFALPTAFPTGVAIPVSVKAFEERVHLINDGDVATGLTARFIMRGSVTNPMIINHSTGNAIKVIDTFTTGDVLEISTVKGNKTVVKNQTNITQKTDASSVFSDFLMVGDNEISYDADSGDSLMDVYIYYSQLYLGV